MCGITLVMKIEHIFLFFFMRVAMSVQKLLVATYHCGEDNGVIGLDCFLPEVYAALKALHLNPYETP